MVIERWHGVHQIRELANRIVLSIPPVEAETGAESRWEAADTADRGLGDQFNGVDNLPRHQCPLS